MIVEGWGMVKLVFKEAFFGVSGTQHFFCSIESGCLQRYCYSEECLLIEQANSNYTLHLL